VCDATNALIDNGNAGEKGMMQFIEFQSGANTLRGMLHLPESRDPPGPHPAVLFLHGFTGQRMEAHFLFVHLARELEKLGLAALRFDFAGSGESDGEFADMTVSAELGDASAALDFLRRHAAIDERRIGVVGLSLGGCVAGLLAGRRGEQLACVALLSAVAEPARILSFIRQGKFDMQLVNWGHIDWDGLMIRRPFLLDLERHHAAEALGAYDGPVLVVHGSEDNLVPRSEAEMFCEARQATGKPTQYELLAGAGHTFASIEHTAKVTELLRGFLGKNLK
jgi:hypothetical protein